MKPTPITVAVMAALALSACGQGGGGASAGASSESSSSGKTDLKLTVEQGQDVSTGVTTKYTDEKDFPLKLNAAIREASPATGV